MIQERIKSLRLEAKLTQKQIAEKLEISTAYYSQWEVGKRTPASKNLQKLADFYNVTTDYLLGNTNDRHNATEIELDEALDNSVGFNGKKLSDNDKEILRNFLIEHFENEK